MALGELLLPPRYAPLHPTTGALVPNGKLRFSRTGTTTDQDTYSDSALTTPNANPVILSAAGLLETKVYANPSSGYNYRIRLYTSADVLLWTEDDVVVPSRDVATVTEGSFTGTMTGMTGSTTGTVNYRVLADDAGTAKYVVLYTAAAIQGTSNTTALTMTGIPSAIQPATNVWAAGGCMMSDAGSGVRSEVFISGGTATFYTDDSPPSATGWTNSGAKGTLLGTSLTYPLP